MHFLTSLLIIAELLRIVFSQDEDERSDVFCPDLLPEKLSLEATLNVLYLFGSRWDSLEVLMSKNASALFQDVVDNSILFSPESVIVTSAYRNLIVMKFLDILNQTNGTSEDYRTVEDKYFIHYENDQNGRYTNRTKKLFYATCVTICWAIFNQGFDESERDRRMALHCPTPCKGVCGDLLCISEGIFEHQYRCMCQPGYEWSVELHTCISKDLKKLREIEAASTVEIKKKSKTEFTKCDASGTWREDLDPVTKETICICLPHREGQYCNMSVDACKARIQHPFLPNGGLEEAGNVACNVNYEGNICESFTTESGNVRYKCTCNGITWGKDSKMNYDNCLKRRTMCDSIVCVYGKCVSNEIGTEVKCVCEYGYSGYMCSEWVGIWSEWSPWDKCRPACGNVRLSVRTRDCISMMNDPSDQRACLGASIEYSTCVEHPCSNYGGTFISTYFSLRQNSITAAIVGAAVACLFMTIVWLMFMWNTVAKPFSDILHDMLRRRNSQ